MRFSFSSLAAESISLWRELVFFYARLKSNLLASVFGFQSHE